MRSLKILEMAREFFTFSALLWGVASAGFFLYLIVVSAEAGFVTLNFNAAREMFIELYVLIPFILAIAVVGLVFTLSHGGWVSR